MMTEGYPLTREDFHTLMKKINMTQNEFEQNQKTLEIENAAAEEAAIRRGNRMNEPGNGGEQ